MAKQSSKHWHERPENQKDGPGLTEAQQLLSTFRRANGLDIDIGTLEQLAVTGNLGVITASNKRQPLIAAIEKTFGDSDTFCCTYAAMDGAKLAM